MQKTVGTTTTKYTNILFSQSVNVIVRNIFDTMGNLVQTTNGAAATTTAYFHPDILGSTSVTTGSTGHMAEAINYYPYGMVHADLGTVGTEPRKYIGQIYDTESNFNYLNARYQDPQRGQFLSEDPLFWGVSQNLADPQSMNSYSYANNNPITRSDPTGLQCVGCAGAEVGLSLTAQATYDKVFGPSTSAVYGGDTVAATVYGFAYPWTLVAPAPVAGISAGLGNIAQQGLEYISGDRTSPDFRQVGSTATTAFGVQLAIGKLPIPFIASSPLTKQITTKLTNGTISNVSSATLGKIVSSGAKSDIISNFTTSYVQSQISKINFNSNSQGTKVQSQSSIFSPSFSVAQSTPAFRSK